MEIDQLTPLLENHDYAAFLNTVWELCSTMPEQSDKFLYTTARSCFLQLDPLFKVEALIGCLKSLLHYRKEIWSKYSPMLLGLIPNQLPDQVLFHLSVFLQDYCALQERKKWKKDALVLFRVYWSAGSSKLASRVPGLFGIGVEDLDLGDLIGYVLDLLEHVDTTPHGLCLLTNLPALLIHLDLKVIIKTLVKHRTQERVLEWVETLDLDYQCFFIEQCITLKKMKLAWKSTKHFHLEERYYFTKRLSLQQTIKGLIRQKLWGPALQLAEDDQDFQISILSGMLNNGEFSLAKSHQEILNLPDNVIQILPEALEQSQAKDKEQYLQLTIPEEEIWFIDQEAQLEGVFQVLNAQSRVGMDSEWRPSQSISSSSILQLACEEHCFILDIKNLKTSQTLLQLLTSFFQNGQVFKLGFSFQDDIKSLQKAFSTEFDQIENFTDLQKAMGSTKGKQLRGLKSSVVELLGKPLNKGMQVSNWDRRPLTSPQLYYAALDAHVLLALHTKFTQKQNKKHL